MAILQIFTPIKFESIDIGRHLTLKSTMLEHLYDVKGY